MSKIYIVTTGEYSDYHIDCVFDSKELAEKYVSTRDASRRYGGELIADFEIEEFEVNANEIINSKLLFRFRIAMNKNGNCQIDAIIDENDSYFDDPIEYVSFDKPSYRRHEYEEYLHVGCLAKDFKHAAKIANEKRTQIIASNIWGYEKYNKFLQENKE